MSDKKVQEFIKDKIELSLERKGNVAYLKSKINDNAWSFKDARVNLVVTLPPYLNLKIVDGSGSIDVRNNQGDVTVKDGSGGISTDKIGGNLTVADGSGSIEVSQVAGYVLINDGSGSIDINDVGKDVTIESNGSGSCNISGVNGRVFMRD